MWFGEMYWEGELIVSLRHKRTKHKAHLRSGQTLPLPMSACFDLNTTHGYLVQTCMNGVVKHCPVMAWFASRHCPSDSRNYPQ